MKPKRPPQAKLTEAELQLIERLRQHPELAERIGSILEITATADGPLKRADDIEELLIEELRLLGNVTMESWASRAEQTLGEELQRRDPSAAVRKKKR